ncbi:hypothetical protein [Xanthomonas melonis]|uniref:hypothetical protein n=1 Tax=Xanthomonas melonis TaxID=56456 RepID=UPI001E388D29|nr:hypothetical protein [Xanthomonas melonis]MCD0244773.1 hypothetical protein [Xanthomonas melonis]
MIHDGSVLYRGRHKDGKWQGPFHHFIFDKEIKGLVELPASSWDGEFSNLSNDKRTKINKNKLIELASNAVSNAKELLDEGRLGIVLKEREIELYYKYLFHSKTP